MARRRFGYVRVLSSGRFQGSFVGPNGTRQSAPTTFRTKRDAERWLAKVDDEIARGRWVDERLGRRPFREYAEAYLSENPAVVGGGRKRAAGTCGCT